MKRGCTQCGECLNVCPVFREFMREEYAPKGKRLLLEPLDKDFGKGEGTADPALSWDTIKRLAKLCAGCGRCKLACARKLSTADLLADARNAHPHWSQFLWEIWIKHLGPLWPTIGYAASLVPESITPEFLKTSIAPAKALVNTDRITPWVRITPDADVALDTSTPIVFFAGCTANRVRNQWRDKAKELLERFGYTLMDPSGFTCCGGSMHHAGQYNTMNSMREQNIKYWKELGRPRIAAFCASCFHSLEEYAGGYLDQEDTQTWKNRITPLSALLKGAKAEIQINKPELYGYHQPCHWGNVDKDMPFLQSLFGGMKKGTGLCCGMGGILKMSNPDLSMQMAGTCLGGFPEEIDCIITGCSGCAMQLGSAAGKGTRVYHWLDVID